MMYEELRRAYLNHCSPLSVHAGLGRHLKLHLSLIGTYYVCSYEHPCWNLLKELPLVRTKASLFLLVAYSFFSPKMLLSSFYEVCFSW